MANGKASPEYPLLQPALLGQPMEVLHGAMTLAQRREIGAFFTGQELLGEIGQDQSAVSRWLDPACGAGDLLLAVAQQLPMHRNLSSTFAIGQT